MAQTVLNEKTEITEKNIHLLVTSLCDRKCPNCCNHLYTFDEIPYVTKEELSRCENVFLTGGEPFAYTKPNAIARKLRTDFPNIQKVIVYTNAYELANNTESFNGEVIGLDNIDGLTVSIKTPKDKEYFDTYLYNCHKSNDICYYFSDSLKPEKGEENWKFIKREWVPVKEWKPAPDSIFRKL